ncbi:MAG: hypothetical protein JNG89_17205, partial [Planctomycetaceae bacterium]|nr:hypothetical protein [Planctomycetaceae bacterium]
MSGRNEELLSAYFDGELTGDEKSLVEQRLADDVAARDTLDDMAEVSAWIRSLPRPAAPADLHGAVLSRVRAAATPVHVAAPASRPQRRWNLRRIAATSAALLAVVVIYRAWPVPLQRSAEVARGVPVPWSDGVVAPRFDAASVRTASLADDPTTVAFANSGQMLGELAKSLESGAIPVPGEVVHEVAQVGDQVLFVQYRVVDTQDLPGQVQVILTNNGISTVHNSPAAGQTIVDFDTDQNGQLEAIYLDAPVTNFNSAVAQITDLDQVTCVATNSVSFTAAATEGMPLAASAQSAPLEQPLGLSVVEPDASVPVQEGRFARELDGTVAESIADDSV